MPCTSNRQENCHDGFKSDVTGENVTVTKLEQSACMIHMIG